MFVCRSNRAELIIDELATWVAELPQDPFAPECIVVQSLGMARYIAMRLADRLSVWANPAFPFPRAVLEQCCDVVLGVPEQGLLTRERMAFMLAELLWEARDEATFTSLSSYHLDDPGGDRLLQLAERMAGLFDDYAVYRGEMVLGWERGESPDDPQAELWRRLFARTGAEHMAARMRRLVHALAGGVSVEGLPGRIALFGLSTLPPLYLEAFSALSRRLPVRMFELSPCQEYWALAMDAARVQRTALFAQRTPQELHLEVGNRLLSSFGGVGRELSLLLERCGEPADGESDHYEEPGHGCMLHVLQSDILHMVDRRPESRVLISDEDRSIEVHVCHSPMREIEVLHDQLLHLFQHDGIAPEGVVVMAPDIEAYAPLITAVFGAHSGRTPIPFRVADRSALALDPTLDALRAVLNMIQGRLALPEVLDVLARAAVRGRFGVEEDELSRIREWAAGSGMRWGADAEHRSQTGQPACAQNTLQFGLDRLLLGFAMEGDAAAPFEGLLPYDGVEGSEGDLLGRFSRYCRTLLSIRKRTPQTATLPDFAAFIDDVLGALFSSDEAHVESLQRVRQATAALVEEADQAGFAHAVGVSALCRTLMARVSQVGGAHGFLSGGVTFCQMLPMRSVPFPIVVLLGMEDGGFPRKARALSFDRRREARQLGDRSLRDDDRYLFLEAILSARKKLLVSYVGRSVHDNSEWPPSVVLAELLDTLEQSFDRPGGIKHHVCVEHPLSAMSPEYFGSHPRIFTYAEHLRTAAVQTLSPQRTDPPFFDSFGQVKPLAEHEEGELVQLSLRQLESLVSEPIKEFMRSRLALALGDEAKPLPNREVFEPTPLEQHALGDTLLGLVRNGHDHDSALSALRASGTLPMGTLGLSTFESLFPDVQTIVEHIAQHAPREQRLADEPFELRFGRVVVSGALDQVYSQCMLQAQYSKVARRSELKLWVRHLILNHLIEQGHTHLPDETLLLGRSESGGVVRVHFAPPEEPSRVLLDLCALAEAASRGPIPFTLETARAFVDAESRKGDLEAGLKAARAAYQNTSVRWKDPYVLLAIPDEAHLLAPEAGFPELARRVFGPLLRARTEQS